MSKCRTSKGRFKKCPTGSRARRSSGPTALTLSRNQAQALKEINWFLADYANDFPEMLPLSNRLDAITKKL